MKWNTLKIALLILISIYSCTNNDINKKASYNFTKEICDSVTGLGVSFSFPSNLKDIDSLICIRNNSIIVWTNSIVNNEKYKVTIYDTFLYNNNYQMLLFFNHEQKKIYIKHMLFKPKRVYHGEFCSIESCEFNNRVIKDVAGTFELPVDWDK